MSYSPKLYRNNETEKLVIFTGIIPKELNTWGADFVKFQEIDSEDKNLCEILEREEFHKKYKLARYGDRISLAVLSFSEIVTLNQLNQN